MQTRSVFRGARWCAALMVTVMAQAAMSASAQARTLETAFGEIDIEGQPQRVVTLYEGALDTALAAGIKPLAAVSTRGGEGVASYLGEAAGDIAIVGTARETNIEAVIAQRPDLILASSRLPEAQYRLLSQVAPTVVPPSDGMSAEAWKDEARLFAQALDREAAISARLDDIETRAAALAAKVPEGGVSATLVRWMPQGPMVMSRSIFATGMLAASGFRVDDGGVVEDGRPHSSPLSLENLGRIDSDWLFLATLNADGEAALSAARQSPAFERLDVVQRDHVVPVDGQLWTSASGPLAAERILETLTEMPHADAP